MSHYMTDPKPDGCTCWFELRRIPGEPHIPAYYDAEWNPTCPIHSSGVSA